MRRVQCENSKVGRREALVFVVDACSNFVLKSICTCKCFPQASEKTGAWTSEPDRCVLLPLQTWS